MLALPDAPSSMAYTSLGAGVTFWAATRAIFSVLMAMRTIRFALVMIAMENVFRFSQVEVAVAA
jgi:hypothetical protein